LADCYNGQLHCQVGTVTETTSIAAIKEQLPIYQYNW